MLQLNNSENWELFYSVSQSAAIISGINIPIPEITIPILLDKHIIAIYITSPTAKETWYFAGYLNQRLRLGLTIGGNPEADGGMRKRIWLNRIALIILPKLTPEYGLSFNVPRWFKDVNISIYKYTGTENEPIEDTLVRLESKIDALNAA
jgi:hypothetical protein